MITNIICHGSASRWQVLEWDRMARIAEPGAWKQGVHSKRSHVGTNPAKQTCAGANYSFFVATLIRLYIYQSINQSINPSINIIYLFRKNSSAHILVDSDMCGFFQTATAVWWEMGWRSWLENFRLTYPSHLGMEYVHKSTRVVG
jgi:hypothetical protein